MEIKASLLSSPEFSDVGGATQAPNTASEAFSTMVKAMIDQTNEAQLDANAKAEGFARKEVGLTETVLAVNKADLSLRMLMEVRNRALEAYRELTRAV
ncbi:MAG: flagellar hook-basal body complex protein FliE [Myxococcota bacterium]|jgi:flagellar hook-basal body complex protein FliE|nr:flagellar hook-basal body complex protein FliE [Myxococcota bacterium]